MNRFKIIVDNIEYNVESRQEEGQIIYEVYHRKLLLTTLGINHNDQWVSSNGYPPDAVEKFGKEIESHEA